MVVPAPSRVEQHEFRFAGGLGAVDRDMAGEHDERGSVAFGQVELDRRVAVEAHVPDVDRA